MNIKLNSRISITTERAESSYGIPVLVIDDVAYAIGDNFMPALNEARELGELAFLGEMDTAETALYGLASRGGYGEKTQAVKEFLA